MQPYATVGDCHLGKEFRAGVPLSRVGEREASQMAHFYTALLEAAASSNLVIQVGDLFNAFVVKNNVVQETYIRIRDAATFNPKVTFIYMGGNHDLSKDTSLTSSFELLSQMSLPSNVRFVLGSPISLEFESKLYAIIPWNPIRSAKEQVHLLHQNYEEQPKFDVAFCHCDTVNFGNDFNYIPVDHIEAELFVTGHEHTKCEKTISGKKVTITGSLEPFSHAEDPDSNQYKTVTLEEALQIDPESVRNLNLRVILKGDETPDGLDLNCLSLTFKRVEEDETESQDLQAIEHGFDVMAIFKNALSPEALAWVTAQEENSNA